VRWKFEPAAEKIRRGCIVEIQAERIRDELERTPREMIEVIVATGKGGGKGIFELFWRQAVTKACGGSTYRATRSPIFSTSKSVP
jgi:arabinogalactan endo-1,4-beta-galactosidase